MARRVDLGRGAGDRRARRGDHLGCRPKRRHADDVVLQAIERLEREMRDKLARSSGALRQEMLQHLGNMHARCSTRRVTPCAARTSRSTASAPSSRARSRPCCSRRRRARGAGRGAGARLRTAIEQPAALRRVARRTPARHKATSGAWARCARPSSSSSRSWRRATRPSSSRSARHRRREAARDARTSPRRELPPGGRAARQRAQRTGRDEEDRRRRGFAQPHAQQRQDTRHLRRGAAGRPARAGLHARAGRPACARCRVS